MAEVSQFNAFGVAPCPHQGGRELSEKCWNGAHLTCDKQACKCLCHGLRDRRKAQPYAEQLTINIEDVGTIEV